jgi:hypothetical protein
MTLQLSRRAVAPVAALALLGAGGAQALASSAKPVHGATYAGEITRVLHSGGKTFKSQFPISFAVSANGKSVSAFTFTSFYPIYCQGGGFGSPQSKSGKISEKGKFKVKLPLVFAPTHAHEGFLVISGTFAKHGKVSGTAFTDFTKSKTCNGTTKFSAKTG